MDPPRFRWTSAMLSHAGLIRQQNEDDCLDAPTSGLWAVADGMGGHAFGATASRMVVEVLRELLPPASPAQQVLDVRTQLQGVNAELRAMALSCNVTIIGSTVVTLAASDDGCTILWAGDSRAYLLRAGVLRQLTTDHRQGSIQDASDDQYTSYAWQAIGSTNPHAITRAVGAADTLVLDAVSLPVEDGDIFLLCSDGLTNEVSDAEIADTLLPGHCRHAAEGLIALALQRGGRDNVSVIVLAVEDLCSADLTIVNQAV